MDTRLSKRPPKIATGHFERIIERENFVKVSFTKHGIFVTTKQPLAHAFAKVMASAATDLLHN